MTLIPTIDGPMEESALLKTEGTLDTEVERTTWVEYCLKDCADPVHQTQQPSQPEFFCPCHVHRSVAMTLKQWPDGLGALLADL